MRGKKLLAVLLCCVTLLALAPSAAFADEPNTGTEQTTNTVPEQPVTAVPEQSANNGQEQSANTVPEQPASTETVQEEDSAAGQQNDSSSGQTQDNSSDTGTSEEKTPQQQIEALIDALPDETKMQSMSLEELTQVNNNILTIFDMMDALGVMESDLNPEKLNKLIKTADLLTGYVILLQTDGNAARIGDIEYETLDAAIAAAKSGDTIYLLQSCVTGGMDLSKNLTIVGTGSGDSIGNYSITFNGSGIALHGASLTFKDCTVDMLSINSTPYAEWNWMTICASAGASLTLDNTVMTMDNQNNNDVTAYDANGNPTMYGRHAIYFCGDNELNILNHSEFRIVNYKQDAVEWDGNGAYNVNIKDSIFVSDNNRSGFTGTFNATIDNSNVQVVNSTGNGSNGSNFVIKNQSTVYFSDNADHGLSTGTLTIEDSSVTANGNGGNGIHTNNVLTIKNSTVEVKNNNCGISSQWTVPGAIHIGAGDSSISGSTVTVTGNKGSGIYQKAASGSLTVADDVKLVVQTNTAEVLGYGGGIYVNGTVTLGSGTELYNNHAGTAGDDIYVADGGTITFGEVGKLWNLDGTENTEDCRLLIDGWYDDSEGARWTAHKDPWHCEEQAAGTVKGPLAIKAAHGVVEKEISEGFTYSFRKVDDSAARNPITGAKFYIYSDPECTQKALALPVYSVAGLVGITLIPEKYPATYYIKEDGVPSGYMLDDSVLTLTVAAGETTTLTKLIAGDTEGKAGELLQEIVKPEVVTVTTYKPGTITLTGADNIETTAEETRVINKATVNYSLYKRWVDASNTSARPSSVTVKIYADGVYQQDVVLTADGNWTAYVTGLRKYNDEGKAVSYTVEETRVPYYTAAYSYNGNNIYITNSRSYSIFSSGISGIIKTGDDANLALWGTLAVLSLAGIAAAVIIIRRKKNKSKGEK